MKRQFGIVTAGLVIVTVWCGGAVRAQTRGGYRTEPVVVTATRTPQSAGVAAGNLDVVSQEDLAVTAAPDIKAALGLVPSLSLQDVGSPAGVATVSLRGSTSGQVLVLLDGRRLADAQSGWYSLNDLPVPAERIERIEVLATPASALYGADALGGVVNIITKPVAPTPALTLALGGGSNNEWRTAAGAQVGLGNLGIRLDGQIRSGDGYRENGDFDLKNLAGTARLNPNPWGINVEWQYLDREAGVPGSESYPTPNARQEDTKNFMRADFTYLPKTGWDVKGGVSANTQDLMYENPDTAEESSHKKTTRGVDLQWDYDTGRFDLFTVGGEWTWDRIDSTNDGEHDMERWGLYAQDQWRSGNMTATLAIRRDQHSVYGGQTSPSITMMWQSEGGARIWLASARGYRAPTFDDLYWSDAYMKGNPDLKPEKSWSYEYGMEKAWKGAGLVRLSLFKRKVEKMIQWTDADGDYLYQPENVDEASVQGGEAAVEYHISPSFSIPVSYQYLDTEDANTGERLAGVVRSHWRAAAQYAGRSYSWSLESASTDRGSYQYRSGDWNYLVLGAACSWKGKVGNLPAKATLRIDNLQDKSYETVEGYPMPGRTFYAEVGIGL